MTSYKLTKSASETLAVGRLDKQGYSYLHGDTVSHDEAAQEFTGYSDVVMEGLLRPSINALAEPNRLIRVQQSRRAK